MEGPRTRGHEPRPNDELWIRLFGLCEQQGRRWPDLLHAVAELTDANDAEQVGVVLLGILTFDPARQVVNAAAVKDARRAIDVAVDILQGIGQGLERGVIEAARKAPKPRKRPAKITCPACGEALEPQGAWKHVTVRHGWTMAEYHAWWDTRKDHQPATVSTIWPEAGITSAGG